MDEWSHLIDLCGYNYLIMPKFRVDKANRWQYETLDNEMISARGFRHDRESGSPVRFGGIT